MIILITLTLIVKAPIVGCLMILVPEPINPYEAIWKGVCQVESSNNPLAYHLESNGQASIGIAQISWGKLQDFNEATGKHYKHVDMYNPVKSREVFMWHTSLFNVWEKDNMVRAWNGSGKATYAYLEKVKKKML